MLTTILLPIAIFFASIAFSMMGLGGGVIYTPIQVWLGIDFHVAATTSLFLIMVSSFSASLVFQKAKRIDWPLALALESVTCLASFLAGFYSNLFSSTILSILFALVTCFIGIVMIQTPTGLTEKQWSKSAYSWKRERYGQTYCIHLPFALASCLLAGFASGLLGIGGGILKVPVMVMLLGVPMNIAVGSSAFMVGLTALGGFSGHVLQSHWDIKTSLLLGALVFIGGQIGARKSIHIENEKLKKGFGYLLLFVALTMIFRSLILQ